MSVNLQPYKPPETDLTPLGGSDGKVRTSQRWWLVPFLYPFALVGSFYGIWLIAWCDLGHMPRPSVDDPNSIGGVTGIIVGVPLLVAMLHPSMLALGFVFLFYLKPKGSEQKNIRGWWLMLTAYVLLWIAAFWIIRWDPLDVFEWYGD